MLDTPAALLRLPRGQSSAAVNSDQVEFEYISQNR